MSAIVHRCTKCGHNQIEHTANGGCSYYWCDRHEPDYSEPELIPTFDINGALVERVFRPGEKIHQWGLMCACADCQALYAGCRWVL